MRFAVCAGDDDDSESIRMESETHEDISAFRCEDGMERTQLTKKVVLAMEAYRARHPDASALFMRVDDDTFVAWNRLRQFIATQKETSIQYMGVPIAAGHFVNRNRSSIWYQPEESYAASTYPLYMQHGPGYLIGGHLVRQILDSRVATENLLSNEDQAVGVWIDLLRQSGADVKVTALNGTTEYRNLVPGSLPWKRWSDYPYVLHHKVKADAMECLTSLDIAADAGSALDTCFQDSMLVTIFSARRYMKRRALIRKMSKNADPGSGRIVAKFAICSGSNDTLSGKLAAEESQYHDLLLLDCEEGYQRTRLTRKLHLAMKAYYASFGDKSLFMKVDDDTFISWKRLQSLTARLSDSSNVYMGIPALEGMKVNRDPKSSWYQPLADYPAESYPTFQEGGPGYVLGWNLVRKILHEGIAGKNVLSNEDQAAGVWVNMVRQKGVPVRYVSIPGTDGYKPEYDLCHGTWQEYKYTLHHRLDAKAIACLAEVEAKNEDAVKIDTCFENCMVQTATRLQDQLISINSRVDAEIGKLQALKRVVSEASEGFSWLATQARASMPIASTSMQAPCDEEADVEAESSATSTN